MKLIIVEGPDNTGKSTVVKRIYNLLTEFGNVAPTHILTIHNISPSGNTIKEKIKNIDAYNENMVDNLIDAAEIESYEYVILDRSWYSEYVYGQLYRNRTADAAKKMVLNLDRTLSLQYKDYTENVWLVMLNSDNPNFLLNHEDGNSLSVATEKPLEMMEQEIALFNDVYDIALCNKVKVIVNNNDSSDFKTFDEVMDEVTEGLF